MVNIMMKHIKTLRNPEIGGICENTLLCRKTLVRHLHQYKQNTQDVAVMYIKKQRHDWGALQLVQTKEIVKHDRGMYLRTNQK